MKHKFIMLELHIALRQSDFCILVIIRLKLSLLLSLFVFLILGTILWKGKKGISPNYLHRKCCPHKNHNISRKF